ncbi:Apm2, medium subunit of the adaptin 2 complex [Emiliania huxleyi CCMP1516]|jgi:AP-2 complex subunit mu-1|uniref:MHD domain-containing protein n=5 Tax=Noelaerhabdaceae TaxID=418966 RepID=A0A0D3IFW2_EMIH1|nr:Apm2, medium subunit of the adaptin 2 complex [Emiliania huxleyi CCMP1516]XP_005777158.1 Apm2, medium subunit of the adaptin 2 complex [Emiliania huxleyi CCMP1516]ALD47921.1 adaptor protein complex 2 subunit mu [Emiliania huxleyi]EOD10147.1 Apm2, medium subunit of the adaptin 2 complex [Emiliania huxleyi CCMP1516]EOD24729.1 Apm2, medium subunit of the adaptin 2 complex [Emiliania huxleyi CCMP1516]|mmetsp:Transcript_31102/g.92404  ORF Transcript_31102/g.92404 Transcript_31102/m.92404 type:complete len:434 (+) Transcript_31102:115-1416(+)|eukprot:XP_005762576.1 Apm2, medium subunit of the adaptin 2 complex [Emiliania huxleyi CCMP1516]
MISNVLLINQKGEVVISRIYREGASQKTIDTFRNQVIASKEAGRLPVKVLDHTAFMFIKHGNMYAVAVSSGNAQAALAFQFLHELIKVLKSYFGDFTEESVRNNFILIYELLDEVLDYGYPQNTSDDVLKMYITQEGNRKAMQDRAGGASSGVTIQATGAISWRKEGIKYRKNELFIDVVENCNLLMSSKGTILRNDVSGCIMVKCYLSGQPECKFGLNDKLLLDNEAKAKKSNLRRPGSGIDIDDVSFHQCVKLGKFDMDRTISFVPPDGEFQLMSYRITENVNLPFRVLPVVKELGRTRLEINIKVKSMFTFKLFATNVVIKIPCPKNTAIANVSAASGKCKYEPEHGGIIWKLRRFPGDTEYFMSGEVEMMQSVSEKVWSRPPITMDFQVPMFAASGLHVRFLKVFEKSNYQTIKWVRYITKAGQYQHRI